MRARHPFTTNLAYLRRSGLVEKLLECFAQQCIPHSTKHAECLVQIGEIMSYKNILSPRVSLAVPSLARDREARQGTPSMPQKRSKAKKEKRNRFALSKSKSKKLGVRSRYVDTFQSHTFGAGAEKEA